MKFLKFLVIFLASSAAFFTVCAQTQLPTNANINIVTANSGVVNLGAILDLGVTVANTGVNPIQRNRVRANITVPIAIGASAANALQTALPAGWIITTNNGTVISICNGTDVIPAGVTRSFIVKIQANVIGGPSSILGALIFGTGTSCTALGGSLNGDNPADNSSSTTMTVIAAPACAIAVSAAAGTIACNGGTTTLTATATGTSNPVEYSLNGGAYQLSNTFTVDAAGSPYTVTTREVATPSCTATATAVTVTQPAAVTTTAAVSAAIVAEGGTGAITASATGGTGTLTYVITSGTTINTTGAATGIFTGLLAGTYVITATDANTCTGVSNSVLLADGAACTIAVSAAAGTIACNGGTTTLTATATGARGTVEYSLNGGAYQLSNTFTVNAAGSPYTVTTREVAIPACNATATAVTVTQPAAVTTNAAVSAAIVAEGGTGTITASATGGTGTLTYVITSGTTINTTGAATGIFTGLLAGTYVITATDANTCTGVSNSVLLADGAACTIAVSAAAGTIACNGGTTTLTATATGARGTVEYSLNGGAYQSSNTFTVNAAGSPYTVTTREVATPACTATATAVTVTQPAAVTTTAAVSVAIVAAGGSGAITASATGGTGTLTYVITSGTTINTTGAATGIFTGLLAGTYIITATDANTCTGVSNSVLLADGAACTIAVSAAAGTISCNGGTTTLTATATGARGTVEYSLNGGAYQSSNTFTVNAAGSPYTVTTREVAIPACNATATAVTVTQPAAVTITAAVTTAVSTTGGTGTITAIASGGTPSYTYVINSGTTINTTGATTGVFTNINSGNYTFIASDSRGCLSSVTSPVFLSDFPALPVTLLNFTGSLLNCKPTLNWITESEINSDRFEIERATQNTIDWVTIGTATAQGNSAIRNKYNFSDVNVAASTQKVFYRLKIIDKDGQFKYSPIVPVFINCKTTQINTYPNPVQTGLLNVNIITINNEKTEAVLISAAGQVVLKLNLKNGLNTVNVSNIANGEYLLKVNATNTVNKVLIQNKK